MISRQSFDRHRNPGGTIKEEKSGREITNALYWEGAGLVGSLKSLLF